MKILTKAFRLAKLLWGFIPITLTGLVFGAAGYLALSVYGESEMDYVFYMAGFAALAIVAVAISMVLLSTGWFVFSLLVIMDNPLIEHGGDSGVEFSTGFRFSRLLLWPFVEVSMRWIEPQHVRSHVTIGDLLYEEHVAPLERGRIRSIRRLFTIGDIFGLVELSFPFTQPAAIRIAPTKGKVDVAIALRDVGGEGYSHPSGQQEGEMIEMRNYQPGDPLRLLLWKVFARTRRLLVRMPEIAITPQRNAVIFMVAGAGDEPSASTARTFVEEGLRDAEYLFSADGAEQTVGNAQEVVETLIDSAQHRERGGEGLHRLLQEIDWVELSNCVIFVPAQKGDWIRHLKAFAAQLPTPPTLVLAVDGAIDAHRRSALSRMFRFAPPRASSMGTLPALYDSLCAIGGPVRVIHRPSGRLIDVAGIDALRTLN